MHSVHKIITVHSALCVLLRDVTLSKVKAGVWFAWGFPLQRNNRLERMTFVHVYSSTTRDNGGSL